MNACFALESRGLAASAGRDTELYLSQPVTAEDLEDIAAARAGSEGAFACLVERYEGAIHVQMRRFSREPGVVRELVQDVFVEAYLGLGGFGGQAPFLHWLRRIATRVGYRYWTRNARTQRVRRAVESEWRGHPTAVDTPSDAAALLFEILAHMPVKDRLVLTLFYFDALPANEIAQQTGWSETLVRVRLHRSRNRLRKLIESTPAWKDAL